MRARLQTYAAYGLLTAFAATALAAPAEDYVELGFDRLASFRYTPQDWDATAVPGEKPPSGLGQVPEAIKRFDGQKAKVTGFILPVKMEGGLTKEFLLMSSPMLCCYGVTPRMNEWILVTMRGRGAKPVMDVPVSVRGTFHVEEMFADGYQTGIYRLDGDEASEE